MSRSSPTPTAVVPRLERSCRQDGRARARSVGHGDLATRPDACGRRRPSQRPGLAVHLVRFHPPTRRRGPRREHGHRRRRPRQRDVRKPDRNDEDREAQPVAVALRRGRPRRRLRVDRDLVQPPPQALQSRLPLTPRVRDRIGFQTMRSTPTLSETRTQSLRVGEAEPDRRCCDRARVSHEESECAEGHGRREESSSVVRRAAHCVSEPCLHRALRVGNARVPGLADKGKDVHIETSV